MTTSEATNVRLHPFADIGRELDGHELIGLCVGLAGDLFVLLHRGTSNYREERNKCSFARIRTETPHDFRVLRIHNHGVTRVDIQNQYMNYHFIQPLPENRFLLVCGRCRRRSDSDIDLNAQIFSSTGEALAQEFMLGDGIQDVQVTSKGRIWVSYFDEGVFGNFGWEEPIGAAGLICFDDTGAIEFSYNPKATDDFISDCYALNVPDDEFVWFYYYTKFRLVKLRRFEFETWWEGQCHF